MAELTKLGFLGFLLVVGLFSNKITVLLPCELVLLPPKEPSWKRGLLTALAVGKSSFDVYDLLDTRKFTLRSVSCMLSAVCLSVF